jgi:hypothetical protein
MLTQMAVGRIPLSTSLTPESQMVDGAGKYRVSIQSSSAAICHAISKMMGTRNARAISIRRRRFR